jgi:hypothetical protein
VLGLRIMPTFHNINVLNKKSGMGFYFHSTFRGSVHSEGFFITRTPMPEQPVE